MAPCRKGKGLGLGLELGLRLEGALQEGERVAVAHPHKLDLQKPWRWGSGEAFP